MTHLRKADAEELQRRNLSAITTRIYLHSVEEFAQYFKHSSPDRLGLEPIRQYQAHLFTDRKLRRCQRRSATIRPTVLLSQDSQAPVVG